MDIRELGAIGELVEGVAVVASLLFVGVQVRANTREQRAPATSRVEAIGFSIEGPTVAGVTR